MQNVHAATKSDYVQAVAAWVRQNMVIVSEPDEILVTPSRMLREIEEKGSTAGDCDDASVLAATMLYQIGIPVRFKAVFPDAGGYQHVFPEYNIGNGWRPLDLTTRYAPVHPPDFRIVEV